MIVDDLRILKEQTKMTSQEIADKSGVPLPTVKRILSGQTSDPGYSTVKAMLDAMGQAVPDANIRIDDRERLLMIYERVIATKNKWIQVLALVSLTLAAIFIFLLVLDLLNPNIGFVRIS